MQTLTLSSPGNLTFSGAGEPVSFEVAGTFLPSVLLSVRVRGRGRVELGAGGAGDTWAGAHGVAQPCVCHGTRKDKRMQKLTLIKLALQKYESNVPPIAYQVPQVLFFR